MKIQAIWENGVFRPTQPLQLKHELVTIQVPDEEIAGNAPEPVSTMPEPYVLLPEVVALANAMEESLDKIRNAPLPDDADLPALTQKQMDRIEAFAMRDEIRSSR